MLTTNIQTGNKVAYSDTCYSEFIDTIYRVTAIVTSDDTASAQLLKGSVTVVKAVGLATIDDALQALHEAIDGQVSWEVPQTLGV